MGEGSTETKDDGSMTKTGEESIGTLLLLYFQFYLPIYDNGNLGEI